MAKPVRPRRSLLSVTRSPFAEYENRPRLRLDKNENLAPDPRLVKDVLARLGAEAISNYPDYPSFYRRLSRWLGCRPENLLITAGSDGAIKLVFESYLEEGDEFVVLSPSFAMFKVYGQAFGGRAVEVPFNDDLSVPMERLLAAIGPKTKIVAIASPNNPTGTLVSEVDFLRVIRRAARFGALVLADEAYYFFTRRTVMPVVLRHRNVVLTRTFSKACGLAALRLGFAYARPEIIKTLRKTQPIFDVNALALACADHLMRHESRIWDYARRVDAAKRYLVRTLAPLDLTVRPSHGNFVLIDLGRPTAPVAARLKKAGVAVGHGFAHPALRNCLKVTVGPEPIMKAFVARLKTALRGTR